MINDMLEKVKTLSLLTAEEREKELAEADKLFTEIYSSLPKDAFDFAIYEKLLPLMYLASQAEHAHLPPDRQSRGARERAMKLSILFGDYAKAISYLERYEKQYFDSKQLVHNACLFALPDDPHWDYKLWRGIISHQNPSRPKDLILRILPFVKKIEEYIKNNKTELIEEIRKEITAKFELMFSQDYDERIGINPQEFRLNWIERRFSEKKKVIDRDIKNKFNAYLCMQLNLPARQLSPEERQLLKHREKNLLPQDFQKLSEIKTEVESNTREKIERNFSANKLSIASQEKKEYILSQLEKSQGQINAEVKDRANNILSATTPVTDILRYSRHVVYTRASENPNAAELFFSYGMSETSFNKYLSLEPKDDPSFIPDVVIDGLEISANYQNYYIKKLSPFDPQAAILGKITSCCQSLGFEGEEPTIHGITDSRGGFYVLCKKGQVGQSDRIVAQCWAWRGEDEKLIFDSIESNMDYGASIQMLITDFYTYLADTLVRSHGIPTVLVGVNGGTPDNFGVFKPIRPSYPVEYKGYRDSKSQRLVADKEFPVVEIYQNQNPTSMLQHSDTVNIDHRGLKVLCDYICQVRASEALTYLQPFISKLGLQQDEFEKQIALAKAWIEYLNCFNFEEKNVLEEVTKFINDGINLNLFSSDGDTILHLVASKGNVEVLELLVEKGANVNAVNKKGKVALDHAINLENWQMVSVLVKNGADVKGIKGESVLWYAARAGKWDVVKLLIENGANANAYLDGETMLHNFTTRGDEEVVKMLLGLKQYGLNINLPDARGRTPLHLVNKPTIANLLLENGADINAKSSEGTPLYEAAAKGKIDIVKLLVEKGADINIASDRMTALHIAAYRGKFDVLKLLVQEGGDVNLKTEDGKTVLYEAIRGGHSNIVKWLIDRGADVQACDPSIVRYAVLGCDLDTVKLLMDKGAKINANSLEDEGTALHSAVSHHKGDVVRLLLDNGADVNVKNKNGDTPMHLAESIDVVKLLTAKGASGTAKNNDGRTPFFQAANNSRWSVAIFLLQTYETNVNEKNYMDRTPLHLAVIENSLEAVKLLLEKKADVKVKDRNGETALDLVMKNGRLEMISLFLKNGVDVNEKNSKGETMLYKACRSRDWDGVKFLVENGADVNEKMPGGTTALHIAAELATYLDIVSWLMLKGASETAKDDLGKTPFDKLNNDTERQIVRDKLAEMQKTTPAATKPSTASFFQPGIGSSNEVSVDESKATPNDAEKVTPDPKSGTGLS